MVAEQVMITARNANALIVGAAGLLLTCVNPVQVRASTATAKQQSLDEWRSLTAPAAEPPTAFIHGDHIRFFFHTPAGIEAFVAHWSRLRAPTGRYQVNSALLHWQQRLPRMPDGERGWRQATVIAGADWRELATNLLQDLAPTTPGHGFYYQAFLADRLLYRDTNHAARFALPGEHPAWVTIERRFSIDETLEVLARVVEAHLDTLHPGDAPFLLMAPNAERFTQPLLLDRKQRQCILLSPAALYDSNERGSGLTVTMQGVAALVPESHGLALIKNPISSAARLVDLGVETLGHIIRLPLPKPSERPVPLNSSKHMDLQAWEAWLDRYTGTRREEGSLELLVDGDRFFSRFRQAVAEATNHVNINVFIFDRDDVAVRVADQLKQRSADVKIRVILDQMGSIGAGVVPPATALPVDFVPPASISSYLREGSKVRVRPFLNPWLSADHAKVLLVDGTQAWVGGMNIGREYRYEWHDLMVELRGPVVASLETDFRRAWAHAGPLGDVGYAATLLRGPQRPPAASGQWGEVRLLPTRTGWKPFSAAVFGCLARAQSYAYIENLYLFDKRVIAVLVRARERGVDVRVVLPCVNDFKTGGRSNLVVANYLLSQGVRVYFYPGMTHVKALLVDDWACVGSGNLNHLSLHLNQEQNVATSDPAFTAHLKNDLFTQDFAHSYELTAPISVDWVDSLADLVLEGF